MQILHSGRYGYHPLNVGPSAVKAPIGLFRPRQMSQRKIRATVDAFANCSVSREGGYDGVEIMGSEGYLINQFIATRTNHRKDDYGGSYTNRIRSLEIVRKVRQEVGKDFIIIFRLSMLDHRGEGQHLARSSSLLRARRCRSNNYQYGNWMARREYRPLLPWYLERASPG